MLEYLLEAFNAVLLNDKINFSKLLKTGKVIFLFKDGCPLNSLNYRPITLQESLLKIFCNIINKRLLRICIANNIISKEQAGFTPEKSTDYNIAKLILTLENSQRFNKDIFVLTVDIKKAFDSISLNVYHKILGKLKFSTCASNLLLKLLLSNKIVFTITLQMVYSKVKALLKAAQYLPYSLTYS